MRPKTDNSRRKQAPRFTVGRRHFSGVNPYSTSLPHTQIRTSPSTRQPGSALSLHALFPLFRNVLPLPYFVPYFLWTVVLFAACERSCAVCFALFLPLYAASAPVYSLLYGLGRSPQLHHGAVFSLLFKGERPRSFCDYILGSILRWWCGEPLALCCCRGCDEPVTDRRRLGDFPL